MLYSAQNEKLPNIIIAHNADYDITNDENSLYKFSKPVELICEAKGGKLTITDKTNGITYEGTYKVKSWKNIKVTLLLLMVLKVRLILVQDLPEHFLFQ